MDNYDFKIVDRLAHAYGWSIEYISELEINEVNKLLEAIGEREMIEKRSLSLISALAACGKTLDDVIKRPSKESVSTHVNEPLQASKKSELSSSEEKDMIKMFQCLGMTHDAVIKGLKNKKLEI